MIKKYDATPFVVTGMNKYRSLSMNDALAKEQETILSLQARNGPAEFSPERYSALTTTVTRPQCTQCWHVHCHYIPNTCIRKLDLLPQVYLRT